MGRPSLVCVLCVARRVPVCWVLGACACVLTEPCCCYACIENVLACTTFLLLSVLTPPRLHFPTCAAVHTLRQQASAIKCADCPRRDEMVVLSRRRRTLRHQVSVLQQRLSNESLSLFPDFKQVRLHVGPGFSPGALLLLLLLLLLLCIRVVLLLLPLPLSSRVSVWMCASQRLSVLETLGYISEDGAVALKGRVAAQINTADELLLTEMIFESTFGDLEPEEIVAVLSALVFQVLGVCMSVLQWVSGDSPLFGSLSPVKGHRGAPAHEAAGGCS